MKGKNVRKITKIFMILVMILTMVFTLTLGESANVIAAEIKSDSETAESYADSLGDNYSTQNSGRVWTDKSVFTDKSVKFNDSNITVRNDSDFLVSLSALATTDQVIGEAKASLDVVFVVDMSGSMVQNSMANGETRFENMVEALDDSVNAVLDMNEQSRIGVVAFNGSSTEILPLDHYSKVGSNDSIFTSTVSGGSSWSRTGQLITRTINSSGTTINTSTPTNSGTNIQKGVAHGMNLLKNEDQTTIRTGKNEVQRIPVLIVLSDGEPTSSSNLSSWWNMASDNTYYNYESQVYSDNAMKVLMTAAYMKKEINANYAKDGVINNVTVYTVGVGLEDKTGDARDLAEISLDPKTYLSGTIRGTVPREIYNGLNNYLNGSSPTVDGYTFNHPPKDDFTQLSDVFYSEKYIPVTDDDDITDTFESIVDEIALKVATTPTEISAGGTINTDGYITFTDPIGKYLEIKDVKQIIWNNQSFTNPTFNDGSYQFTGTVNTDLHGEQELSYLLINVTEDANGDQTLVARIPASLIPVRKNTIVTKEDASGKEIVDSHTTNDMLPIRILYTVGLKDNVVIDGIVNSEYDENIKKYIEDNMNSDGTVNFYSNLFTGKTIEEVGALVTDNNGTIGNTTAEFEPSPDNGFYYMQGNTVIYGNYNEETGEYSGTFSSIDELKNHTGNVHYPETYYHGGEIITDASIRSVEQILTVRLDVVEMNIDGVLKPVVVRCGGSPRTNRIMMFRGMKNDNTTDTASTFYVPTYIYEDDPMHDYDGRYCVYLGNNGVMKIGATGNLEFDKTVTSNNGLTVDQNKEFNFTIQLTNSQGDALTDAFTYEVLEDDNAVYTGEVSHNDIIKLKDGQKIIVRGLPHDTQYNVSEALTQGFETTVDSTKATSATGTISAGQTSSHSFVNHYSVSEITFGDFVGSKTLTGRDWTSQDVYDFEIQAVNDGPLPAITNISLTLPEGETIKGGQEVPFDFGDITFNKPGEYKYLIVEKLPPSGLPGTSYSKAVYEVTVNVLDNGDGTLSASSTMIQTADQMGQAMTPTEVASKNANFVNVFNAESIDYFPLAEKIYIDKSETNSLRDGMFEFRIDAITEGAPLPAKTVVGNTGVNVQFESIHFGQEHAGQNIDNPNIYSYTIKEVIPDNKALGMTYDETVVNLDLKVFFVEDKVTVNAIYRIGDTPVEIAEFTNTYEPNPTTEALKGTKTLNGRNMLDTDEFEFLFAPADQATKDAIANGEIIVDDYNYTMENLTAEDGTVNKFEFEDMTFNKPGIYTFEIKEKTGHLGGITYDTSVSKAVVTVVDNHGQLEATTVYNNGMSESADFVNEYDSVFTGQPINLSAVKVYKGQSLEKGEFFFSVELDGESSLVTNENGVLSNDEYKGDILLLNDVTFDEAGTYIYTIKENIPANKITGVNYDLSTYKYVVEVTDNYDGTLTASTQIIKVKDSDGNDCNVEVNDIVFNNTYVPNKATYTPVELTKIIEGRPLSENEFTFVMKLVNGDADGIHFTNDHDDDGIAEVQNDKDGKIIFGNIEFTKAGTYVVGISESIPSGAVKNADGTFTYKGVTYDNRTILATFTVTDNQVGNLIAARTDTSGGRIFTNIYESTGELDGQTYLEVEKEYHDNVGNPWTHDALKNHTFKFILSAHGNETIDAVNEGIIVMPNNANDITITVDTDNHKANFGNIIFNKAGTYVFVVKEDTSQMIKGIVYDSAPRFVVVNVEENEPDYNGELSATATVYADTNNNGLYDTTDAQGTLTFENIYVPDETVLYGHDDLIVEKIFEGRENNEWLDDDSFTFVLEVDDETQSQVDAGNVILPNELTLTVDKTNKDHAHFGDMTFKTAGRYVFTVYEEADLNKPWIQYDTTPRTIVVNVEDENGILVASLDDSSDELVFTNTYERDPATLNGLANLSITKQLDNRQWFDSDEFKFSLAGYDEQTVESIQNGDIVLPQNATELVIKKSDNYTKAFGDIVFNKPNEYIFIISEIKGNIEGVQYTSKQVLVNVTVVDNNEGELLIDEIKYTPINVDLNEEPLTFYNTYTPSPVTLDIKGTKAMTGRELKTTDKFSFTMAAYGNAPMPQAESSMTIENDMAEIDFGTITYTQPGTYRYAIYERTFNAAGVRSDRKVVNATATVTYDDETGLLNASIQYSGQDTFTFTNTYTPERVVLNGSLYLTVKKNFTGRLNNGWLDSDSFTFMLAANDDNTTKAIQNGDVNMPASNTITINKDSDNFKESFGDIVFNKKGTYVFDITEVSDLAIGGIEYDDSIKTVTVIVTDVDEDGYLEISNIDELETEFVFENEYTYDPVTLDGTLNLEVTKDLQGRNWFDNDIFTFELQANEDYGEAVEMPDDLSITVDKNTAEHKAAFSDITFNEPGTYNFTISEVAGQIENINYSSKVVNISVVVIDNDEGQLVIENITDIASVDKVFTNTYTPNAITAQLSGNKVINGREFIEDIDVYEFNISVAEDSETNTPLPQTTTIQNDTRGNIDFGHITYTSAGTYKYIITETKGDIEGITYDEGHVKATVVVTYDEDLGVFNEPVVTYEKVGGPKENINALQFINTYEYKEVTLPGNTNLEVTKDFVGRDWFDSDAFTFELEADEDYGDAVEMPDDLSITINKDTANHKAAFSDITFNEPGNYEFTITEVQGNIDNVEYSHKTVDITVRVIDNKLGQLVIENITDIASVDKVFTNTYTPSNIDVELTGTKLLSGRTLKESDKFNFTLTAKDGAPMPQNATVQNNNDEIVFGPITYSSVGEYKYEIIEEDTEIGGITKDYNKIDVVVEITYDATTGLYSSDVKYSGLDTFEFRNVYDPSSVVLEGKTNLEVVKVFTGRENNQWLDGDVFTFTLEAKEDYGDAVEMPDDLSITIDKNTAEHKAAFSDITFNEPGNYEFTISEVKGDIKGVSYDANSKRTVKIVVSDHGEDGQLDILETDKDIDSLQFTNTYSTKGTSVVIEASKTLLGRVLKGNEFKFILEDTDTNETLEAYANAQGHIEFEELTYNEIGVHHYKLYEEDTELHNVSYDNAVYEITVEVKDDNEGQLYTVVTGDKDIEFKNTFTPDPIYVNFDGSKGLNGRVLKDGEFEFVVETTNEAPLPQVTKAYNDENGDISFGTIVFEEPGTYEYIIKEIDNGIAGIEYDSNDVYVEVVVSKNDDGILSETVTYTKNNETINEAYFENNYTTKPTDITLDISKKVNTKDGIDYVLEGSEFTFKLIPSQNNENDPVNSVLVGYNDANGKVVFDELNGSHITYSVKGTYEYTLVEESGSLPGMSYDDTSYNIVVTIEDDEDNAQLYANVVINEDETNKAEFINEYDAAKVSTTISGIKELISEHKDLEEGQFTFTIETDNAPLPSETEVTNDESGYFQFDSIEYDKPGDYVYTIKEMNDGLKGYGYDEDVYYVYVNVTHNQETGELVLEKTIELNDTETQDIKFMNTYEPDPFTLDKEATIAIEGRKVLLGRDALTVQDGEFSFKLLDGEGNIALDNQGNELIAEVEDGKFVFEDITYTHAGTYHYSIVEQQGTSLGITYDKAVYDVVVTVTDLGGYLDGEVEYFKNNETVEEVVFTNEYTPVVDAFIKLDAKKVLIGRKLKANEFRFVLENIETSEKLYAYADENGIVEFDKINYSEVGTYTYKIYEEKGILDNITYDDKVYEVVVEVKDDLNGNLTATLNDTNEGLVFTNVYTPDAIKVNVSVHKVLTGDDKHNIPLDQFKFEILDKATNKTYEVLGTKDGHSLYELEFDHTSIGKTYEYVIKEVDTKVENVTYDQSEHKVSITILQDEDGALYAKFNQDGKDVDVLDVEFNNHYTPQVETNDNTPIMLWAAMMFVSTVLIKVFRRKEF